MQQLRETIWTLRSTEIPIKSFQARIESYLRTFFKDSNIHLDFTIQNVTEPILKPLISLTLFRIIQEVATNCLKYSNASKFIVEIKTSSGQMELVLKDDGIGFDTKKQSSGYGIENIIARAEEIKAKMTLYSEPTLGTEFYIKLKLK
jgi:signal transduction histidine kinase